ncbi:GRAS family protein RAD1 [Linum grandiflorum]
MESINNILSFSAAADDITTLLNSHDLAIRQFCPARLQHEHEPPFGSRAFGANVMYHQPLMDGEQISASSSLDEIRYINADVTPYYYHDHHTSVVAPTSITHNNECSEVDAFVNSFINVGDPNQASNFHIFQDEMETFDFMFDHHTRDHDHEHEHDHEMDMSSSSFQDLLALPSHENVPMVPRTSIDLDQDQSQDHNQGQDRPGGAEIVDQGLHLVHLLLACAEAVGCRDTRLAESLLNQIWSAVNPWGDSLQRVSHCFAMGLKSRLSLLLNNVNPNGTFANGGAANDLSSSISTGEQRLEAFHLLHQTTPYVAFGFMAANEAIVQAATGKQSLHIIDLGMEHTLQWPSLLRSLSSRPGGPPARIRITGLMNKNNNNNDRISDLDLELESRMKLLAREARSIGIIGFEFNLIPDAVSPSLFNSETLDLKPGETLFVNGVMNLHKFVKESRGSLKAILQAIKKLSPTLVTVVEQDANHNGPFFLGRFLESLHYYSAIFDSLEAIPSLQRSSVERVKMETRHFGEEIRNIVAYEGSDRVERHERADQWRRQLGRAGFQAVEMKCMSQARMLMSVYGCCDGDGFTLASEKGFLLLGWKGRPILLASAWQVHPHHHHSSSSAGSATVSSSPANGF